MSAHGRQVAGISGRIARQALLAAFRKLGPRQQARNPVMFVVYLGALAVALMLLRTVIATGRVPSLTLQIDVWLWFTVLFANFAEALAEGRGKAQADALRKGRRDVIARKLINDVETRVPGCELRPDDLVVCEAGDVIPSDGEIVDGIASIDESAITGESAPVIRESGGDRSAVIGGTRVISDRIVIRIVAAQGATFIDKMIALIEGARRQKTPNEIALGILLFALTLVFLLVVATLRPFALYSEQAAGYTGAPTTPLDVLIALLVCLIPTTIGGLLTAIGISGIDRLIRRNVLAMSGRAVEAAGDIDVLLLDKTGTITLGNRMAAAFLPAPGVAEATLADAAQIASLADETPEGRSIVVLAKEAFGLRGRDLQKMGAHFVPFSARTQMSGVDIPASAGPVRMLRKGSLNAITAHIAALGGTLPAEVKASADRVARAGGTPLIVAENKQALGIIQLKDVVKGGMRDRFAQLRTMGIRTVMVTGDNALTAAAIAAEAGVDDFIAEATPEAKLKRIRDEQAKGHLVAMTGDGTNDAPALAQADVGVAMNTGTQAAREAGNMVDLDSNPTKLIEIVEVGKQILITRGALTTFSIANDVAKYFAILPAMFGALYAGAGQRGPLLHLDVMHLHSPASAVLSAVIYNAVIIVALIPLALHGVKYRSLRASALLLRNLLVYGLGGVLAPFIGIKLIDLALVACKLV